MTHAAVYGTGSWGTAFAAVLADAGTSVRMWGRRAEVVDQVNAGVNEDYLPELRLPPSVTATTDPQEAAAGADIVVLAVPSQTLRANLTAWAGLLPRDAPVVSLMKANSATMLRIPPVLHAADHPRASPSQSRTTSDPCSRASGASITGR